MGLVKSLLILTLARRTVDVCPALLWDIKLRGQLFLITHITRKKLFAWFIEKTIGQVRVNECARWVRSARVTPVCALGLSCKE